MQQFDDPYKVVITSSNFFEIVTKILSIFKLRAKEVSPDEARIAIMKGKQCLCHFCLFKEEWKNFNAFLEDEKNKKRIITPNKILIKNIKYDNDTKVLGHVVVLISIEEKCLKLLNSYGRDEGDNGYFGIKDHKSLRKMKFVEIYWEKDDLTKEEKDQYKNNYFPFIKQASNYLSEPDLNIKKDLQKEVKCPMCKQNYNLNNFELILYQEHKENDETDTRKLKIKCLNPKCNELFESDSITTLLYLKNLIN